MLGFRVLSWAHSTLIGRYGLYIGQSLKKVKPRDYTDISFISKQVVRDPPP